MKKLIAIITSTILLLPVIACGGEDAVLTKNPALTPPEIGGLTTSFNIIKVLAAFMVVAGVMALVFKLMRRLGPASMSKSGLIEVLDTRMITQKKYISVVRIAGQDLAVAISENNISLLCTLNKGTSTAAQGADATTSGNSEFDQAMATATEQEDLKA